MDNSKKYMKHPDNEKLPHMPESLLEYLAQFIMGVINDTYKKELSDFISCGEYFGIDMKKALLNSIYGDRLSLKVKNVPKSLESGLYFLCSSNSKDIKERYRFALYPPDGYRSTVEKYYRLYNGKFINDEELGLLCEALYQKYLKSSK